MMKRTHLLASILLLSVVSLAQQPSSPNNAPDQTATPNDQSYSRPIDQTYNQARETAHNWGGWGLLGLLGLGGLLGRRRATTTTGTTYTRDERTYGEEPRRRAG